MVIKMDYNKIWRSNIKKGLYVCIYMRNIFSTHSSLYHYFVPTARDHYSEGGGYHNFFYSFF
jgi:hypothetical protein